MKKIKVFVETNLVGSTIFGEIEVEDNATDDEVELSLREWMFENIEWGIVRD